MKPFDVVEHIGLGGIRGPVTDVVGTLALELMVGGALSRNTAVRYFAPGVPA